MQFRPVSSYSILTAYLTLPFRKKSIKAVIAFFKAVFNDFFFLQFSVKFHIKNIEVINVDHPLDSKVPFLPEKVGDYLGFVDYWIQPLSLMLCRFGEPLGLDYCVNYVKRITKCYTEASRMYRFRMSTTVRPEIKHNKSFRTIRLWDPHYLCVPSLHIAIVILTWSFYKKAFFDEALYNEKFHYTNTERDSYISELYNGAVNIGETVLYVKQHSANCIPAALYMMTRIAPDLFSIQMAVDYINDLFKTSNHILQEDKILITEHIQYLFERLVLEGCNEEDWVIPVQRWILKYNKNN